MQLLISTFTLFSFAVWLKRSPSPSFSFSAVSAELQLVVGCSHSTLQPLQPLEMCFQIKLFKVFEPKDLFHGSYSITSYLTSSITTMTKTFVAVARWFEQQLSSFSSKGLATCPTCCEVVVHNLVLQSILLFTWLFSLSFSTIMVWYLLTAPLVLHAHTDRGLSHLLGTHR